ncbi:tetraacyldisaccharide 4'-kinase [Sulfurimonas marina]|uniref:Tetraacyldisaccharide 4'-kinase n=1 Tax=Sulfurimonas marina TaxID=2590551 RepID=A0A7M1AU46_9BACT|nr:tetraacyldisaccharide 4'-kinase [Sulfurimonas marina]QOP40945.1 tetraacyldisaccharide 4'-kinase [Sulfurimonas marina]
MKRALVFWVEGYLYNPNIFQKLLSYIFLPLSFLYCFIMWVRFRIAKPHDFGIDIISVGNLVVGGSGKTPFVTALAQNKQDIAIILRGYGRDSSGLIVVKDREKILVDVSLSGDEAMIYAKKLPLAIVIVSEDRKIAIQKAKEMGVKQIFLDDAYSKHSIKKRDILIDVKTKNSFCLPSGPYREKLWSSKEALVVEEEKDFIRKTTLIDPREKMSLVTAIARPQRLDKYLPEVVGKHYFEDHHSFTKEELETILQLDQSDSLLVTFKDYVKIEKFGLPLSLLDLELQLKNDKISRL